MRHLLTLCALSALSATALASGHGPVFGYATPVNSAREFTLDTGLFARQGSAGTQFSTATGLGYGLTPHLTVNAFLPANFGSGSLPESRVLPGSEWSASTSWRFFHSVTSVGKRLESTATLGVVAPGPQPDSGPLANLHRAPGITGSLAAGMASRSQYLWFGGGYTHFAEATQTHRPSTASWSAVYGYRPPKLRRRDDQWDYRGFAELTGEHTTPVRLNVPSPAGTDLPSSSTTSLWLGPTVLAIYKNVAISGGLQAPLYRDASNNLYGQEHLRLGFNISYLKYSSHTDTH